MVHLPQVVNLEGESNPVQVSGLMVLTWLAVGIVASVP